jgi:type IV secretion system protein VirB11
MIARNKPAVRIGAGLNPGPTGRNRRNFVGVHVSYRAFLRARAFRPKMLGGLIPMRERIISIEDAAELVIRQPNFVRHFYAASGVGVSPAKLLKATLRERPDRVMLAEMRDPEAASVFLSEVMAGHPGSLSTLHGRNAPEAARRLFDLVKSSEGGRGATDETVASQLGSAIDFIIPVENDGGMRAIGEVWFSADAQRRGETFADLLKVI